MVHTLSGRLRPTDLLEFHRLMVRTRVAEERVELLQKQGHPVGALYRSLGQEAGAVGAAMALRRRADGSGDVLAPSLRAAGAMFAFGATLEDYFRQYLGRSTGPTRGRESDLHWGDPERGILASVTPLGLMLEVMAGVALTFRLSDEDRVALVFHGDGATSTGAWHEGLSFAAAQRCPMVLVVEHNQFAFGTSTEKNTRLRSFTEKAEGYGIQAQEVDGTDVLQVLDAVHAAARRARMGEGVQMVELRYFRRRGHAQHDAQEYVDPAVLAEWEARDPVLRYRTWLLEQGHASEEMLAAVVAEETKDCEVAAERALAESVPQGSDALSEVTSDPSPLPPWTRRIPPDPRTV
ncbi:MAG TPA: thiamine pyrophosphate-dependent dehydrogenase E1 component subunit alpha [Longimicrobiales bacterium]|nr:thiamine pyrophosphate-dependent dehydrogenase E1 component subunit alpha [Longimicrobiales bacterium]